MKWKLILIIIVLMLPIVFAGDTDICEDKLPPGQTCRVVTPPINCNTYQIFNISGGEVINASMTLFNDSIYYFIFNQSKGQYIIKLCDNSTTAEILVEGEDEMAGLAIVAFVLAIVLGLFILPFKVEFSRFEMLNLTLKRCCILLGLLLLGLSAAMVSTIASNAGIELVREIHTFLFIINKGSYLFMVFLVISFFFQALHIWKENMKSKRGINEKDYQY